MSDKREPTRIGSILGFQMPQGYQLVSEDELAQLERAQESLDWIKAWIEAYPAEVFTPLSKEERAKISAALRNCGVPAATDRLHASWARHILAGLQKHLDHAKPRTEEKP